MSAALCVCAFAFDRIEPPWAILLDAQGDELLVPLSQLPLAARPGDRLATPTGPVLPGRKARVVALRARLRRLAGLESPPLVGHAAPMSQRRRPDHFARRARREGFRARSIYKLEEIDRRTRLLRRGARVLDLGCAPGSWLQYASERVGRGGRVVGIDLKAVPSLGAVNVATLQGDIFETDAEVLLDAGAGRFDVVLSDMAPATSGNRFTDHVRSIRLCRAALEVAERVLAHGGAFVCKVFEGEDAPALEGELRARFARFKRIKPKGTRSESVELFMVAQAWRGEVP